MFSVFLLLRYYSPLKKGYPLRLNKLEFPPPKDDLCHVWLQLAQWFWRRSRKCKSLQTDRQTDSGQSENTASYRTYGVSMMLRPGCGFFTASEPEEASSFPVLGKRIHCLVKSIIARKAGIIKVS
jgi:hypothetical protein